MQVFAGLVGSALCILSGVATSSCEHCGDATVGQETVGECANPLAKDAGADGGAADDFADCHLTPAIASALGGTVPKSGEDCSKICTAASGKQRAYTTCDLFRAYQTADGPSLWRLECHFPSERQCAGDTVVPTN